MPCVLDHVNFPQLLVTSVTSVTSVICVNSSVTSTSVTSS